MESTNWIKEKSAGSLHPPQVETTLIQLNEAWPKNAVPLADTINNFSLGEKSLLHLFAVSSICAGRLTQDPDSLLWLCQPQICGAPRVTTGAARHGTAWQAGVSLTPPGAAGTV